MKFDFKQLLSFDRMITPTIIKILYYIITVITIIAGLGMMISGFNSYYGGGFQVFTGLLTIILAPILVRVYCEILIVVFKINEKLGNIDNTLKNESKEEN